MDNKAEQYVYRLTRDQVETRIAISKGDKEVIKMYKNLFKRPLVAVLHWMIGQSAKCWEEKHEEVIRNLQERGRIQAKIILAYLHKYGPITKKTPMERGKPEAAPKKPEAGQE